MSLKIPEYAWLSVNGEGGLKGSMLSPPGRTTSKKKPSRKVEAFFISNTHLILTSAVYFICRLTPVKPSKSSKDVR